jgi:hypothetical protein
MRWCQVALQPELKRQQVVLRRQARRAVAGQKRAVRPKSKLRPAPLLEKLLLKMLRARVLLRLA